MALDIRIRGARASIPQGYLLGRSAAGYGPVQVISVSELLQSSGFQKLPSTSSPAQKPTSHFGTGAPTTTYVDGDIYFDTSVTPYKVWVQHSGSWYSAGTSGLPTKAGFNAGGLLGGGEQLAVWAFPAAVTFDDTNPNSFFLAGEAAAAAASLPLIVGMTTVGHVNFAIGASTGTLSFTSNPYTLPAMTEIVLQAPSTADATLGDLYGEIVGL